MELAETLCLRINSIFIYCLQARDVDEVLDDAVAKGAVNAEQRKQLSEVRILLTLLQNCEKIS